MSQETLFTTTEDATTIARLRKNIIVLLQNVGQMNFCKTRYVDGQPAGPGCGREVFWVTMRGGKARR